MRLSSPLRATDARAFTRPLAPGVGGIGPWVGVGEPFGPTEPQALELCPGQRPVAATLEVGPRRRRDLAKHVIRQLLRGSPGQEFQEQRVAALVSQRAPDR